MSLIVKTSYLKENKEPVILKRRVLERKPLTSLLRGNPLPPWRIYDQAHELPSNSAPFSAQSHAFSRQTHARRQAERETDRKRQRDRLRRTRSLIVTALAAAGFLLAVTMFTPVVPWWARKLAGPMNDPTGDVLIVLGGSSLEGGIIGEISYWRSVYAVRAYRQSPFSKIIVSGGGPDHTADHMRDFLISQSIPADHILVEDRSTNTHENALYSKQLLTDQDRHLVLLTSDYHMFRTWRVFEKAGLKVAPRPFPDAIKQSASLAARWPTFFTLCGEAVKTGYYWVRGWI